MTHAPVLRPRDAPPWARRASCSGAGLLQHSVCHCPCGCERAGEQGGVVSAAMYAVAVTWKHDWRNEHCPQTVPQRAFSSVERAGDRARGRPQPETEQA